MPTTTERAILRGGGWLLQPTESDAVFTPERMTEEHRLIAQTAQQFVDNEVLPKLDALEQKNWTIARDLVKRSGDLGLLGVDAPETYGGVGDVHRGRQCTTSFVSAIPARECRESHCDAGLVLRLHEVVEP